MRARNLAIWCCFSFNCKTTVTKHGPAFLEFQAHLFRWELIQRQLFLRRNRFLINAALTQRALHCFLKLCFGLKESVSKAPDVAPGRYLHIRSQRRIGDTLTRRFVQRERKLRCLLPVNTRHINARTNRFCWIWGIQRLISLLVPV